jgi:enolase
MKIKRISAKEIKDTRGDGTIEVILKTDFGKFKASAPNGKSRGSYEAKPWKGSLKKDIGFVNKINLKEIKFEKFDDLEKIEKIFGKEIGANTTIALEYVFLKALAKKENKEIWELINPRAKKLPMPVGNAIEGGVHSSKGPDIQEFLFIPKTKKFSEGVKLNKKAYYHCKKILKKEDSEFKGKRGDENGWKTYLGNLEVMRIMKIVKDNLGNLEIGMDIAASEFYKNGLYAYKNKNISLNKKQQVEFISELSKIFYYLEDPLEEKDFSGIKKIKSKNLIVGDDITVTNLSRIKKAGVNAVIIKPNQNGSLMEIKKIVEYCKNNNIKIVFSHRSGETKENILADLAFGFQADFIKTGIWGKGRKEKLKRMINIERSLK